jgi:hypothetical protein
MKSKYKVEHPKLLSEWKKNRPKYKKFVKDGVLNEDIYFSESPRIALLVKESNNDFYEIAPLKDENGWGPEGSSPFFWRNINIWQYAINSAWNNKKCSYKDAEAIKENQVNSIAYINIKKNAECKSVSNNDDLLNYIEADKSYIEKQIELVNPQIILCGGTYSLYNKICPSEPVSSGVYLSNDGRLIIEFYHPSNRKGYENCYNELHQILRSDKVKKAIEKIK